jgi:hypothetical protein
MPRPPTEKSLAEIIYDIAELYAAGKGYELGPDVDNFMRKHAINAARQIEPLRTSKQQSVKFKEAIHNFETLIDAMAEARGAIHSLDDGKHPNLMGKFTLGTALNELCPLWPFC